jgi:hypothetical protein
MVHDGGKECAWSLLHLPCDLVQYRPATLH